MEQKNYGVILEPIKEQDLLFGTNNRVEHNIKIGLEKWLSYFSEGELQLGTYYDTMSCVTFSALNVVEAILNYQIRNKMMSIENIKWLFDNGYLNEKGEVDLSDRFTAIMSGTTEQGNTGGQVWDSIRNIGVIPEKMFSWDKSRTAPMEQRFIDYFLDRKYITQEMIDLAKEFTNRFNVYYEHVMSPEYVKAQEYSPIHVFISTYCGSENGIEKACDKTPNHAVSFPEVREEYNPLFDHYINLPDEQGNERFIRKVSKDFKFYHYGYVCTITEKSNNQENMDNTRVRIIKDENSPAVGFFLPADSPETIENMAELYGKVVPKFPNGTIDFAKFIEGTVKLNKSL